MSCGQYIVQNVITARPEEKVSTVLDRIQENQIRVVPVVDESGKFKGFFSVHTLLGAILPKSVTIEHGLDNVDFAASAVPMVVGNLADVMKRPVSEFMDTQQATVDVKTHTLEGIRLLYKQNGPVAVVERATGRFAGILTEQTMLTALQSMSK